MYSTVKKHCWPSGKAAFLPGYKMLKYSPIFHGLLKIKHCAQELNPSVTQAVRIRDNE
jgi:hypothetical protein